jgi:hypothetical protein
MALTYTKVIIKYINFKKIIDNCCKLCFIEGEL